MCLLLLAVDAYPRYRLVVAANRDEYHRRPTAAASFWSDHPQLLAGRDLEAGGTWLGFTRDGRFAALTNYREPGRMRVGAPSRGGLVVDFLVGPASPLGYLADLAGRAEEFNGFSLVAGDRSGVFHLSNRGPGPAPVGPGAHGLSNHLLDTPWPKVTRSRTRLERALERAAPTVEDLLELLSDRTRPPDDELPDTGVGVERERLLGPPCVVSPTYGTRCSTAILVGRDGEVCFREQTLTPSGGVADTCDFVFRVEPETEG